MSTSGTFQEAVENAWASDRLVYRAIEDNEEDRSTYTKLIVNDPVIRASYSYAVAFQPQTQDKVKDKIERNRSWFVSVFVCIPTVHSCIDGVQEDGGMKPIGMIGLHSYNALHQRADLAVAFGREYQDKGYGSEAITWILDWAFNFGNLVSFSQLFLRLTR
jgi:RimJ/RimL family protein N-acetyltransferase